MTLRTTALICGLTFGATHAVAACQPNYTVQPGDTLFSIAESCLLYTSPSPRDLSTSRMPSSA